MTNLKLITLLIGCMVHTSCLSQNHNFSKIEKEFLKHYPTLNIPGLQISYVSTLNRIGDKENIKKQERFFENLKENLSKIDTSSLIGSQKINFQILDYETMLHLERIALEKKWTPVALDDSKSIIALPDGKLWYVYLLKRWVDKDVSPDDMFQFGLKEIEKVKSNMKRLQKKSGLSEMVFEDHLNKDQFFLDVPEDVQREFEKIKKIVRIKAASIFPYIDKIPEIKIGRGTNASLSQVPAYYSNGTFYYNFFDKPFNKRQLGWFYAHEAIPGHHYQFMVNNSINRTEIQNLFWYPGFAEGWGAYVEYLGDVLGVYETIYDEYGKWEWDLIRSVRVSLDVAINYYGWSDKKALDFWKKYIKNQDDIGVREIARMKRWPAQVISYKYGAKMFLKLLNKAKKNPDFEYKRFHKKILEHGDVPLTLIESHYTKLK
ncbi:DUF885 domain-containing protein [Aquimarina sediminis]|uniref:DUF885 domain-containing protein n=1 Tax=Aquimarina sediminis TaxID=2070536 RepID=UPI000CA007C7|nr:DUF885 domain-containing protein [Aquimarina sediminis]